MPDNTNQKNKADTNKAETEQDRDQMGNQGGGMKGKDSTTIEKDDARQVKNDNTVEDDTEFEDQDEGADIEDKPRQGNQSTDRDRK